jgi:hypothetical protein
MPRPNRSVAAICIAVIAVAALLPGISPLDHAWFEAQWVFLPDRTRIVERPTLTSGNEQPLPLLAVLSSRGPPSVPFA